MELWPKILSDKEHEESGGSIYGNQIDEFWVHKEL